MKIKIHPLFLAVCICLVGFGKWLVVTVCIAVVLLHEFAHILVAKIRGYKVGSITLMPYGAVAEIGEGFGRKDSFWIAGAGPFFNAVLALLCVALWWIFPAAYPATKVFFDANITIAAFNLLPVLPLDGGRILLAFCKNKLRAVSVLKVLGIAVACVCFGLGIASFWFYPNPTLSIGGIFILYGALTQTKAEETNLIFKSRVFAKDTGIALEKKTFYIPKELPLFKTLSLIRENSVTCFIIKDDNEKEISADERMIVKMCEKFPLSTPVSEAIKQFRR